MDDGLKRALEDWSRGDHIPDGHLIQSIAALQTTIETLRALGTSGVMMVGLQTTLITMQSAYNTRRFHNA